MSYDVQFIQVSAPKGTSFPVESKKAGQLVEKAKPFEQPDAIRKLLLEIEGTKPGPADAVDFMGRGLNYARLFVKDKAVHIENSCGAPELLKLYNKLLGAFPDLLILDLQNNQLHNADSFTEWWSRPLV